VLAICALRLDTAEFYKAADGLTGPFKLQPADPRPNSGTSQS
jgi:hypothetical protein